MALGTWCHEQKGGGAVVRPEENQALISVGTVALRAPDGTLLEAVTQYTLVPKREVDPERTSELDSNECLVVFGTIHSDIESAKERFAQAKAGHRQAAVSDGKHLYIKENIDNINPNTGLSRAEEKACSRLIGDLMEEFARHMHALKSQGAGE